MEIWAQVPAQSQWGLSSRSPTSRPVLTWWKGEGSSHRFVVSQGPEPIHEVPPSWRGHTPKAPPPNGGLGFNTEISMWGDIQSIATSMSMDLRWEIMLPAGGCSAMSGNIWVTNTGWGLLLLAPSGWRPGTAPTTKIYLALSVYSAEVEKLCWRWKKGLHKHGPNSGYLGQNCNLPSSLEKHSSLLPGPVSLSRNVWGFRKVQILFVPHAWIWT